MNNMISERHLIDGLTQRFHRSPLQMNDRHTADAEILSLPRDGEAFLAVTTDSLSEEIATHLYRDPYLAGWMVVMANLSDLSAVGAEPLGILISEIIPRDYSLGTLSRIQDGINEACQKANTFVLGGDLNIGERLTLTGTAIGRIGIRKPMTRVGMKPGDLLFTTGTLGGGNAFALSMFGMSPASGCGITYRPVARLAEGRSIAGLASACIDTSDGTISALDELMKVNGVGIRLDDIWKSILDPTALTMANAEGFPAWLFLAGCHGEFELLFTVAAGLCDEVLGRAARDGWQPLRLGTITENSGLVMRCNGRDLCVDSGFIRDLGFHAENNIEHYIAELIRCDEAMWKGVDEYAQH